MMNGFVQIERWTSSLKIFRVVRVIASFKFKAGNLVHYTNLSWLRVK
jgi:hypothetical protein